MIYLALICTTVVVALVFLLAVFLVMRSSNELTKKQCQNCRMYDRTLHTCWPRFEERYPGDAACEFFEKREEPEFENT